MISGLSFRRLPTLICSILIYSCSGNVMQTTVFSDDFQQLEPGHALHSDDADPAIYYKRDRDSIGLWTVATDCPREGFNHAWQVLKEDGTNCLAQTFANLDEHNTPLSLVTHPLIVAGDSLWIDFTLEAEFTPLDKFDKCGVVFRYRHPFDYFFVGTEGNTVTIKQVKTPVTPLRPIEKTLDVRPLVWSPGERLHVTVTVRRNKIFAMVNDSIGMHADGVEIQNGKIGLISDLPARFHKVEVKLLKGEQRKLARRKRQLQRRSQIILNEHPEMVSWRILETDGFGTNQNLRLGDLNGDGNKDLVFVRPDPSGTGVGSITAVNLEGRKLWSYGRSAVDFPSGGDELPVQVHDHDGDGKREVLFIRGRELVVLEGTSGELVSRKELPITWKARTLIFGDLMGIDRASYLILSDRHSHLAVFNDRLEKEWEKQLRTASQPVVFDMDQDGKQEVLVGYSVFDDDGSLMFDVGSYIGDRCNGVTVHQLEMEDQMIWSLVYAAGDWGLLFFDFNGNLLKQEIIGHVNYVGVSNLEMDLPGLELATSNGGESRGLMHLMTADGGVTRSFMPVSGMNRCQSVNWKGDGEEFLLTSADSIGGGMIDFQGNLAVKFPADGHPVACYTVYDLTGDERDEVVVWDREQLWIYTQSDNPRMGNTYSPDRVPYYNHSLHHMNRSIQDWR